MIFKSDDSAKLANPFAEEGESYWSHIELTINSMWFVVKVSGLDDENPANSTLLLSSKIQLVDLTERDDLKIAEVQVMSPPQKNKDKTWRMLQVSKILKCVQSDQGFYEHTLKYVFTDGNELIDSNIYSEVQDNSVFETIFTA